MAYKILIVDDQEEIHQGFRSVFVNAKKDEAFDDLESSLFGDESSSRAAVASDITFDYVARQSRIGSGRVGR